MTPGVDDGDGASEVDRIVQESKEALKKQRETARGPVPTDFEENKSCSSFSSYDTLGDSKGRYKCRACVQSFMSKKLLERHRKTPEHKIREKKYSVDHAKQMEMNRDEDVKFETTFKMACPECGKAFETEDEFKVHGA